MDVEATSGGGYGTGNSISILYCSLWSHNKVGHCSDWPNSSDISWLLSSQKLNKALSIVSDNHLWNYIYFIGHLNSNCHLSTC